MKDTRREIHVALALLCIITLHVVPHAQEPAQPGVPMPTPSSTVPRSVSFNGQLTAPKGDARTGSVMLTFGLYTDQQGGTPLWTEQQLVTLDAEGRYSVVLGRLSPDGLPGDAFAAATPRWLSVQVEGETEQPRFMLLSVPYALKAGDADTVGGKPVSAFVLNTQLFETVTSTLKQEGYAPRGSSAPTSTTNVVAKFTDGSGTIGDSNMVSAAGNVGINVAPLYPLHVFGAPTYQTLRLDSAHAVGSSFTLGPTGFAGERVYSVLATGPAASTGAGYLTVYDEVAGQHRLVVNPNGKVGIGTTPTAFSAQLEVRSTASRAIYAQSDFEFGAAVTGYASHPTTEERIFGVSGFVQNPNGAGVYGENTSGGGGAGVWGVAGDYDASSQNFAGVGVFGLAYHPGGTGIYGLTNGGTGIRGMNLGLGAAVEAESYSTTGFGDGLRATTNSSGGFGIWASNTGGGWAGRFDGNVVVNGTLIKSSGSFKIDHPLDPENQYLSHSFVESPDMMNIYNGNVMTDANGDAVVSLPAWFEALNSDYRYQLTCLGTFAQAMIAEEVKAGHFTIKTSAPHVRVSWQVTGIRQDAWARQHRIPVEEAKPAAERGTYLHPEVFQQPANKSVDSTRENEVGRQRTTMSERVHQSPASRVLTVQPPERQE